MFNTVICFPVFQVTTKESSNWFVLYFRAKTNLKHSFIATVHNSNSLLRERFSTIHPSYIKMLNILLSFNLSESVISDYFENQRLLWIILIKLMKKIT